MVRFILLLGVSAIGSFAFSESFEVSLSDPLHPNQAPETYSVSIALDEQDFPTGYNLHLASATCFDNVCKPFWVTLQWDALGGYSDLEIELDFPLTKKEHEPFESEDYEKLNEILADAGSLLGRQPLEFFAPKKVALLKGIDAVTMPTPLAVQDAVVPGAAYTSWVLWRWVNGEVVDQLFAHTRQLCRDDYLRHCLMSTDRRFVEMALHCLRKDGLKDPLYYQACYRILENSGRANCELALNLLLDSPSDLDAIHLELTRLIGKNGGSSQLLLTYFQGLHDPAPEIWIDLAKQLKHISEYQDLDSSLMLLRRRAGRSATIRLQVEALLDSKDRFVIKHAEKFLKQHKKMDNQGASK